MAEEKLDTLERLRADINDAARNKDRERAGALRLILDALQQEHKFGKGDEVALLQRERKKRLEAAEAFAAAGREESAAKERFEAELIEGYLPAQLSDEELNDIVEAAIAESGATEAKQMGQVIGLVRSRVGGGADGRRISQAVKEKLGA
jgi:uncharacterized protein YqeY